MSCRCIFEEVVCCCSLLEVQHRIRCVMTASPFTPMYGYPGLSVGTAQEHDHFWETTSNSKSVLDKHVFESSIRAFAFASLLTLHTSVRGWICIMSRYATSLLVMPCKTVMPAFTVAFVRVIVLVDVKPYQT